MPDDVDTYISLGLAVKLMPDDVDTYISLGLVYKEQKIFHNALQIYQKATVVDCKSSMGWFNLANTQLDMKFYDDAIRGFETVLVLEPTHLDAWFNLGIAYHDRAAQLLIPKKSDMISKGLQASVPSTPFCASDRAPRADEPSSASKSAGMAASQLSQSTMASLVQDFKLALKCYEKASSHADSDTFMIESAVKAARQIKKVLIECCKQQSKPKLTDQVTVSQ